MTLRGTYRRSGSRLTPPTNIKIKGLNVVPKPSEGPTWGTMWSNYDWTGWLKPQIDNAKTLGANCIKITGLGVQFSGTLYPSQVLFESRLRSLLTYCQAQGLLVYYNLTSGAPDWTTATSAQITAAAAATARVLNDFSNIVGIDCGNEIGNQFVPESMVAPIYQAVRPVTSLPLTFSVSCVNSGEINQALVGRLAPYVDFFDFHPYYGVDASTCVKSSDFATFRATSFYRPFLIGECGTGWDGTTTTPDPRWTALGLMSSSDDCMGIVGFCVADYDNTNKFGIYSSSLVGPRTTYSVPFAGWPAHV